MSNCENNSIRQNILSDHRNEKVEEGEGRPRQRGGETGQATKIMQERKATSVKRRENETFTKRFVNLGNFIQNQYAS